MTQRTIETERGVFCVREAGAADAPPLMMLHGWPQSSYCWQPVAAELGERYRLVMPDMRGLGDSPRTLDADAYTKQALAADMLALADTMDIARFALAGHDWGGAVAQEMAFAAPERVHRLILLNIVVLANARGNALAQQRMRDSGAQALWYQFFQCARGLPEAMIPGNEAAWLGYFLRTWSAAGFPGEAFDEYVRCYAIPDTPATGAAYYRCYKADTQRWAELAGRKLPMPALYIHGRHDPVIVPEFTEHLDDAFDDVRLESVESAHFVPEELPETVAKRIDEFVAGSR